MDKMWCKEKGVQGAQILFLVGKLRSHMLTTRDLKERKESERRDEIKVKQAKFICDKRLSHRFLGLKRVANYSLGELFLNPLHGLPDVGDFPIGQTVKNLPAIQQTWVRYLGSIPGSGRSRGGGNGNLLQYSCLRNPMDRGAWRATVHGVSKSWT